MNYKEEFENIIKDIISHETVQEMKKYRQHCNVSCYEHCYRTAYYCYRICKILHWDYVAAARAAMVHDLFLYDWRVKNDLPGLHAFTHPQAAYDNASKLFEFSNKERDIIVKHMWPVTLKLPRYKESYLLTLMDKYSATRESFEYVVDLAKQNKLLKSTYVLLALLTLCLYKIGRGFISLVIKSVMFLFIGL